MLREALISHLFYFMFDMRATLKRKFTDLQTGKVTNSRPIDMKDTSNAITSTVSYRNSTH